MIREKRRKKRIIAAIVKIVTVTAVLAAALFAIVYFGFEIKKVSVQGGTIYPDSQIMELVVTDKCRDNSLLLLVQNLIDPVDEPEFIEKISVSLSFPSSVNIKITEKELTGVIKYSLAASPTASGDVMSSSDASEGISGTYVYFDSEGVVSEISDTLLSEPLDVSCVFRQEPEEGEKMSLKGSGSLEYLKDTLYYFSYYGLTPDSVNISERGAMTADFGSVSVYLGKNAHTADKIERLSKILPEIRDKSGTVDMSGWSDGGDDIIFEES